MLWRRPPVQVLLHSAPVLIGRQRTATKLWLSTHRMSCREQTGGTKQVVVRKAALDRGAVDLSFNQDRILYQFSKPVLHTVCTAAHELVFMYEKKLEHEKTM